MFAPSNAQTTTQGYMGNEDSGKMTPPEETNEAPVTASPNQRRSTTCMTKNLN